MAKEAGKKADDARKQAEKARKGNR